MRGIVDHVAADGDAEAAGALGERHVEQLHVLRAEARQQRRRRLLRLRAGGRECERSKSMIRMGAQRQV